MFSTFLLWTSSGTWWPARGSASMIPGTLAKCDSSGSTLLLWTSSGTWWLARGSASGDPRYTSKIWFTRFKVQHPCCKHPLEHGGQQEVQAHWSEVHQQNACSQGSTLLLWTSSGTWWPARGSASMYQGTSAKCDSLQSRFNNPVVNILWWQARGSASVIPLGKCIYLLNT